MSTLIADVREIVLEQWEFGGLLWQMTKRDLLLRYKQTIMGFAWAIFMPLVNTAVFSVIFMRVANVETPVPYPLFAYTGLCVWNFFASSQKFAVSSLATNVVLVTKVYFPREVLPLSTVFVCLIDFMVSLLVLVALMIYYSIAPSWTLLWFPVVLFCHVTFTVAIALILSMANLFFRDVKYIFEVVLTIWMFATSVLYPVEKVQGKLGTIMLLNPMTAIVDAYRKVILYGQHPWDSLFITAFGVSLLLLVIAWISFHRAEFRFAESV